MWCHLVVTVQSGFSLGNSGAQAQPKQTSRSVAAVQEFPSWLPNAADLGERVSCPL